MEVTLWKQKSFVAENLLYFTVLFCFLYLLYFPLETDDLGASIAFIFSKTAINI